MRTRQDAAGVEKKDGDCRATPQTAGDGFWVADAEGRFLEVNNAFCRLAGFSRRELLDMRLQDLEASAGSSRAIADHMREAADTEGNRFQTRLRCKDGKVVEIEVSIVCRSSGGGRFFALVRDISEQKRAEEALRASEERYRQLAENANEAIAVVQDEILKYVNPRLAELSGYERRDLLSKPFMELVHPDDRQMVAEHYAGRLRREGVPQVYRFRFVDRSGNARWAEIKPVVFDWDGRPAILALLNDITERKAAEDRLRVSEEKFRLLTEKTGDIIWTTDLNLRTTYVSPSVEKVLGFTPQERLEQSPDEQMTPESLTRVQSLLLQDLERERRDGMEVERSLRVDVEYYHKNGSTVWLENLVSGIRESDGTLVGLHGVSRDITARRRAEEELKASERRYRLVTDNVADVICVMGMDLQPTYFSPSVTRLLGYTPEEAMAGRAETRLTKASLAVAMQTLASAVADEEREPGSVVSRTAELEFIRKDGSTVWVETGVAFLRDPQGRPDGILAVLRDITTRKQAEMARRNELLLKAIHHRVKNNLQMISSLLYLQSRRVADKKVAEMFNESDARVRSMSLIHEKLYCSDGMSSIDFGEYVRDLTSALFTTYGMRSLVTLHLDVEDGRMGIDAATPCGLIVNELVSNSLKHAFPGRRAGEVYIALQRGSGRNRVLVVGDNGVGMPADVDVHSPESLGLQLVNALVSQLNGRIDLRRNDGTQYTIVFEDIGLAVGE